MDEGVLIGFVAGFAIRGSKQVQARQNIYGVTKRMELRRSTNMFRSVESPERGGAEDILAMERQ